MRVWTGGSLACLHLVNCYYLFFFFIGFTVIEGTLISSQFSAIQKLLPAAGNLPIFLTVPNWLCMLNIVPALPISTLHASAAVLLATSLVQFDVAASHATLCLC